MKSPRWRIAGMLAVAATGAASAADWPQFLGPNRNLVTSETNLAPNWPKDGPPTVWQRKVGQGFSGPVVQGDRLILFHRVEDRETVECLDAKTGGALWKADYSTHYRDDFGFDEGPRATPAIAEGRVYTFGAEGALNCWKLGSGEKIWGIDTKARFGAGKGFFGMACSPLVEGELVVMNLGGTDGAGIVAFDKTTGDLRWKATDSVASYSSPVAATFGGRRRVLVITREDLVAADPADGRILFHHAWTPPMRASVSAAVPLVIDDLIFISASYGTGAALLRFKESGPEKIWAADDALSNHYATSVHHDGFLYGFDGRQEQGCELRCVELKTGKVRWSETGLRAGTVMVVNGQLLVLTEKGGLIRAPARPDGFKPTDRAQILPFVARAYPALADGRFYARSSDKMVCLDLRRR
jgi:outer membrane protein assembly factor BamB